MSELPLITKNQFKETTRYLQEQLSSEFGAKVKLSTVQEAVSRAMGFNDYHAYQHYVDVMGQTPVKAVWANGDIATEIQSLRFCMKAAEDGYGTARRIRSILLHLYNNGNPTKIQLKNFDRTHAIHLLNVLALDSRPNQEIHHYIEGSEATFRRWSKQAHLDEEWARHADDIYSFSDRMQRIAGASPEGFAEGIEREWEDRVDGLPGPELESIPIAGDGFYRWRIAAQDQFDYEYSVCIEFNVVDGKVYVCEDLPVNVRCEVGKIYDRINEEYHDEVREYGDEPNYMYRGYYC